MRNDTILTVAQRETIDTARFRAWRLTTMLTTITEWDNTSLCDIEDGVAEVIQIIQEDLTLIGVTLESADKRRDEGGAR